MEDDINGLAMAAALERVVVVPFVSSSEGKKGTIPSGPIKNIHGDAEAAGAAGAAAVCTAGVLVVTPEGEITFPFHTFVCVPRSFSSSSLSFSGGWGIFSVGFTVPEGMSTIFRRVKGNGVANVFPRGLSAVPPLPPTAADDDVEDASSLAAAVEEDEEEAEVVEKKCATVLPTDPAWARRPTAAEEMEVPHPYSEEGGGAAEEGTFCRGAPPPPAAGEEGDAGNGTRPLSKTICR